MSVRGSEWIDDVSRDESPEGHEGSPRARVTKKRKVLSCYACRSRKMRCDRVYPICGRCEKSGRASHCTYDPRSFEEANVDGAGSGNGAIMPGESIAKRRNSIDLTKIRDQERRIQSLEQDLAVQKSLSNPSRFDDDVLEEPDLPEEMMFRGKGFKTAFHGATSVMSSITSYRELLVFTQHALTVDHSITLVKSEFKKFRDRRKQVAQEQCMKSYVIDADIFAALPDEATINSHAVLYFKTWESAYRILHESSFWQEYHIFWEQRKDGKGSSIFAVILILVVAATECISAKNDLFIGDTTADRQAAAELIDVCEAWIGQQSRKRLTLSFFQIRCLSLLAKRANCVRLKQDWLHTGDLIRLALASGLHRDPSLIAIGKISVYEKEMKNRLWATMMEFELQSSIETGLQSSLIGLYSDAPAPINLHDDAFSTSSPMLPAARPMESFTSTSYLGISHLSLPLRIHLTQLLNNPTNTLQHSQMLQYDAQIHSAIALLPCWDDKSAEIPSALLQLQLLQYLILLHKPYAKLASQNNRYMHSLTTIVDTVSRIIAIYEALSSQGALAVNHFRNDILRVGITLSNVVYMHCPKEKVIPIVPAVEESSFAQQEARQDNLRIRRLGPHADTTLSLAILPIVPSLSKTLCAASLELLERTRRLFEQKVLRLGTGYMEYWLLSSAIGILPSPPSPSTSIAHVPNACDTIPARCQKALDHFTTLAFRVLDLQKDPQTTFASSLRNTMDSFTPPGGLGASVNASIVAGSSATPRSITTVQFDTMSGAGLDVEKNVGGPFDALQDMQVDLGEWSFPEFWAFDLSGEY